LLRLLLGIRNSDKYRKIVSQLTDTPFIHTENNCVTRIIETKGINERFNSILTLSRLIQDWPATFLKACQMSSIYKCHLNQDCTTTPKWYASSLNKL
jgi:hypothetical protein